MDPGNFVVVFDFENKKLYVEDYHGVKVTLQDGNAEIETPNDLLAKVGNNVNMEVGNNLTARAGGNARVNASNIIMQGKTIRLN